MPAVPLQRQRRAAPAGPGEFFGLPEGVCQDHNADAERDSKYRDRNHAKDQSKGFDPLNQRRRAWGILIRSHGPSLISDRPSRLAAFDSNTIRCGRNEN